jgi:glucosamine-6-phosphate deaminase
MKTVAGKACPVHIYEDATVLGEAVASRIAARIAEANGVGRSFLLGCPGGRSARSTYLALGRRAAADGLDLSGLVVVMMDEYIHRDGDSFTHCDPEAHYSCRRFARDEIRAVLNADLPAERRVHDENVWLPAASEPASYDTRLREAGGVDWFLVASGASDGHVAFNGPGSSRESRTRIIELAETTRRDNLATFPGFAGLGEVPTHGVSVGIGTIVEESKEVTLLIHGAGKADAAKRVLALDAFDPGWPASCIYAARSGSIVLDAAAAGDG